MLDRTSIAEKYRKKNLRHSFHTSGSSGWPILTSLSLLFLAFGTLFYLHGIYVLIPGFCWMTTALWLFLFSLAGWWGDVIKESTYERQHTVQVMQGIRIGMLLFILSEVMFFFAFFWAFFHSSLSPAMGLGYFVFWHLSPLLGSSAPMLCCGVVIFCFMFLCLIFYMDTFCILLTRALNFLFRGLWLTGAVFVALCLAAVCGFTASEGMVSSIPSPQEGKNWLLSRISTHTGWNIQPNPSQGGIPSQVRAILKSSGAGNKALPPIPRLATAVVPIVVLRPEGGYAFVNTGFILNLTGDRINRPYPWGGVFGARKPPINNYNSPGGGNVTVIYKTMASAWLGQTYQSGIDKTGFGYKYGCGRNLFQNNQPGLIAPSNNLERVVVPPLPHINFHPRLPVVDTLELDSKEDFLDFKEERGGNSQGQTVITESVLDVGTTIEDFFVKYSGFEKRHAAVFNERIQTLCGFFQSPDVVPLRKFSAIEMRAQGVLFILAQLAELLDTVEPPGFCLTSNTQPLADRQVLVNAFGLPAHITPDIRLTTQIPFPNFPEIVIYMLEGFYNKNYQGLAEIPFYRHVPVLKRLNLGVDKLPVEVDGLLDTRSFTKDTYLAESLDELQWYIGRVERVLESDGGSLNAGSFPMEVTSGLSHGSPQGDWRRTLSVASGAVENFSWVSRVFGQDVGNYIVKNGNHLSPSSRLFLRNVQTSFLNISSEAIALASCFQTIQQYYSTGIPVAFAEGSLGEVLKPLKSFVTDVSRDLDKVLKPENPEAGIQAVRRLAAERVKFTPKTYWLLKDPVTGKYFYTKGNY